MTQTQPLHELKTVQPYFDAVASGAKTFEIRFNDRDYQVGDRLRLREYDPATDSYTGASVYATITYVTDFAQQEGHVVLGIRLAPPRGWTVDHITNYGDAYVARIVGPGEFDEVSGEAATWHEALATVIRTADEEVSL